MKKRNSVTSVETTNSADKASTSAKAREQMRQTAASVEFLSIQFSTTKGKQSDPFDNMVTNTS